MSLTRDSTGLVLADDFDRADSDSLGGDWNEVVEDWDIVSNRVQVTANAFSTNLVENDADALGEQFVQAIVRSDSPNVLVPSVMARFNGTNQMYSVGFTGSQVRLRLNTSVTLDSVTGLSLSANTDYLAQLYVKDSLQQGWLDGHSVSATDASHNGTTRNAGLYASLASGTHIGQFDDFIWCTSKNIVVDNLPTGWKAKVVNSGGSVVAEATESSGTAAIDCSRFGGATEEVPIAGWAKLRVTDESDVTIEEWESAGVYPGDAFSMSGPDTPSATATVLGPHAIEVLSSAYSHPESIDIASVEWQIATDVDFTTDLQTFEIEFDTPEDVPSPLTYGWGDLDSSTLYYVRVRHKDTDGIPSGWGTDSATTENGTQPSTPEITGAAPTATTVSLNASDFADPLISPPRTHVSTDWQIDLSGGDFSSPVTESIDDPEHLQAIEMAGLTQATDYDARVRYRAEDGSYTDYSTVFPFTTETVPVNRPVTPTVTPTVTGQRSATFVTTPYSDPGGSPHARTKWWLARNPNFAFGSWVASINSDTDLESWSRSNLTQNTTYYIAAQFLAEDGDWGDWSSFASFTTDAHPLDGAILQITRPRHGEVQSESFDIEWTPASSSGAIFRADYSDASDGVNWTSIFTAEAASPYAWDVSALSTGLKIIRLRAEKSGEVTDWVYRYCYVDHFNEVLHCEQGPDTWEAKFNEEDIAWTHDAGDPCLVIYNGNSGIGNFAAREAGFAWTGIGQFKSVEVIGEVMIGSSGGPFPWAWFPEQAWGGVFAIGDGPIAGDVPYKGIFATIFSVPIWPYGDCDSRGTGPLFLTVGGWEEYEEGVGGRPFLTEEMEITDAVHHFLDFFNIGGTYCGRTPRYGIRLRVSTIELLPDGPDGRPRRRIRVQAAVLGPGMDAPPAGGWHIETTRETNLDCGYCGYVAQQISQSRNPFRSFTGLTVSSIASCQEDDLESCPPPELDLTIFGDDDETPLWGTVDGYSGEISEASFSTDPNHPRPWLQKWDKGPEHEVDPIKCTSQIGTLMAEVLDKRTDPCDQATGFLTVGQSDDDGYSALIGRRAVAREHLGDGTLQIIHDGVLMESQLMDTLVTQRFRVGSARERERKVPLFDTQHGTMSAYPYGPVNGYGHLGPATVGLYLIYPADVSVGTYVRIGTVDGIIVGRIDNQESHFEHEDLEDLGRAEPQYDDDGSYVRDYFPRVVVRWRYPGGDWVTIEDMPFYNPGYITGNVFRGTFQGGFPADQITLNALEEDAGLLPINGSTVEFQVLANTEPNEAFPFYFEGKLGQLLKDIYDGLYSPSDPHVHYDVAAMEDFVEQSPTAHLRKFESEDDLRAWVEPNIYQAAGWVPALSADGEVEPVSLDLPDGSQSLTTLDNTNVVNASWDQDGSRAVPIARFRFFREYIEAGDSTRTIISRDVWVERLARSSALLTAKGEELTPETIREIAIDEAGVRGSEPFKLALARTTELTTRYAYGPQWVQVRCLDTADVRQLKVGEWCILDVEWIPNLATQLRGGAQLALVVRRQKDPLLAWDLTLLLGGPSTGGLSAPTLETPVVQADNSVCVEVSSAFGLGESVRVEYAISDTTPTAWTLAGYRTTVGSVCIPPVVAGSTVWFRGRTERAGHRPSAWSSTVSVIAGDGAPAILTLGLTATPSGAAVIYWSVNADTAGLLVEYGVHAVGTTPVYSSSVELDADDEQATISGATVNPGQQISVRVTPYDGFSGGSVTGSAGIQRYLSAKQEEDALVGRAFSSAFSRAFG